MSTKIYNECILTTFYYIRNFQFYQQKYYTVHIIPSGAPIGGLWGFLYTKVRVHERLIHEINKLWCLEKPWNIQYLLYITSLTSQKVNTDAFYNAVHKLKFSFFVYCKCPLIIPSITLNNFKYWQRFMVFLYPDLFHFCNFRLIEEVLQKRYWFKGQITHIYHLPHRYEFCMGPKTRWGDGLILNDLIKCSFFSHRDLNDSYKLLGVVSNQDHNQWLMNHALDKLDSDRD